MSTIMTVPAVLSTPADHVAITPVEVVTPADPLGLNDPHFYESHPWSFELSQARIKAVAARIAARLADQDAEASFADELLTACSECLNDDQADDPADFSTDPRWDEVWTVEAPAKLTPKELLTPITFYPIDHPARRADDVDRAFEAGFGLGSQGWTNRDVAPCSSFTAAECNAFVAGLNAGESRLWEEFAVDMEELANRAAAMEAFYSDPFREVNEMELAECGSCVGHTA